MRVRARAQGEETVKKAATVRVYVRVRVRVKGDS